MDRPLLAIIPARGGSKGVPQKNLRILGRRPLLAYSVEAVLESGIADRLLVSSESEEILRWAELHGYESHERPPELAQDDSTISQVAVYLTRELGWTGDVGVFQPTSPFRSTKSLVTALETFRASDADSLASVVRENHGFWYSDQADLADARPLFKERVNRQWAQHPVLRETGSIQLVRAEALLDCGQIVTPKHMLFETDVRESLDIDTNDELVIARRRLEQGNVVFRVQANRRVGSGHVHHCLQLADELADQQVSFLLRNCDEFVERLVDEHGYAYRTEADLAGDLAQLAGPGPNLVVNDILDTSEQDVLVERTSGYRVVNVEDLGPGARVADWVVNALYPATDGGGDHIASGPAYATLRGEFIHVPSKEIRKVPERVLVTFGGTDPGQLAPRCAALLANGVDAEIRVVLGTGAAPAQFPDNVTVITEVRSMAAEMLAADLVLTAAGRTVYEAAATGTPVAVLAQGAREASHAHLSFKSGVVFLGIGPLVDDEHVVGVVRRLLADHALRVELSERLSKSVDPLGAARIAHQIRAMLRGL